MQPLVPESRVNKNGVPVIKHVRPDKPSKSSSMLSRIIPALSPSHRAAERERIAAEKERIATDEARRTEIMEFLRDELQKDETEKIRQEDVEIEQETDLRRKRFLINMSTRSNLGFSSRSEVDRQMDKIGMELSLDTLERLKEAVDGSRTVTSILDTGFSNEANLRAFLNFRNCKFASTHTELIIENVRSSTGIDDLAEIPRGSEAHDLVSTVIRVASESHARRTRLYHERERKKLAPSQTRIPGLSEWFREQMTLTKMTRDLADVIVDYPDRVDDILDYMSDRELIPEAVNGGHLRLHLDNAASSLSNGIL